MDRVIEFLVILGLLPFAAAGAALIFLVLAGVTLAIRKGWSELSARRRRRELAPAATKYPRPMQGGGGEG